MGLDMYLSAVKYVSGHTYSENSKDAAFDKIVEATGMKPTEDSPSYHVEATVGYWRKANAIHKWFVDHVQNGKDDCESYYVSREKLAALRDDCRRAIAAAEMVDGTINTGKTYTPTSIIQHTEPGQVVSNPEAVAAILPTQGGVFFGSTDYVAAILPTQGGVFFGSTDYDEGYMQDLRDTIKIIDRVLADPALEDCNFEYRASW